MLTHLDPRRLAATATLTAAAITATIWLTQPTTSPPPDNAATDSTSATDPDLPALLPDDLTPAATPTGTSPATPRRPAGPPDPTRSPAPSPAAPTPVAEPQPTLPPAGRTRATTDVERLAVHRLHADATGHGRDRWPDLTGTPCCRDLAITGIATTSIDDPPAPQTVIVTWTATDRYDGRVIDSVTTTAWHRVADRWTPQTDVAPDVAPVFATGSATVAATRAVLPSCSSSAGDTNPLLTGGLSTARAADIRHTPLMRPSECRAPRSGRGV